MKLSLLFAAIILVSAIAVLGGQGTTTGKEAEGWDTGAYNVVVGRIVDVRRDVAGDNRYRAVFSPLATLGGRFDPSLGPTVPVRFSVGAATSSISAPPPEGALVLALLTVAKHDEEERPTVWIRSDICTFMPDQAALVVIKDLDDPRVAATLKKLQDARAHPDANPYGTGKIGPVQTKGVEKRN